MTMTIATTVTTPGSAAAEHPAWCDPRACFGSGFHSSLSAGPDPAWVTLCRTDEDGKTWVSINHGDDVYLPLTVAEAAELAAAILELVTAVQQG